MNNGKQPTDILDSALPVDCDAEKAVLGSIVLDPKIMPDLASMIRTADFNDPTNQVLWQAFYSQHVDGKPVDPLLATSLLRDRPGELQDRAVALIPQLLKTPSAANWRHYADRVLEVAHRRRLRHTAERLLLASSNGRAPTAAAEDAIRSLSEVKASTAGNGKVITYRRLTCAELDAAEFTTEYLIDWILVAGMPCVVAGPKKACKTTILIALAVALAMGGRFLNRFAVLRCCRVLLMTGESGLATVQESTRRIASANGYSLADIGGLIISDQLPVLGNSDYMIALKKMIADDEIEVLILDPAYLCLPTDGNEASLFAMGALLREISELCHALGVTLILCHHTKKGIADPFAPPELESIAWAGFQEWARQWILLGRREKYEPGSGKHQLWFSAGGSAGHSSLWAVDLNEGAFDGVTPRGWQVDVMKPDEARQQAHEAIADAKAMEAEKKRTAQLEVDRKRIVQVLIKCPLGETKSVIRDRAALKSNRMDGAIASLLQDGTLGECQIQRENGRSYDAFKIKQTPDSEV